MTFNSFSNAKYADVRIIEVEVIPLEDEKDDFDTVSVVEEIIASVKDEAAKHDGYLTVCVPMGTRGGEVIQLISQVAQGINDNKEFLASMGALTMVIRILKQWRRVKKLELSWGNKTLIVEDADSATVKNVVKSVEDLISNESNLVKPTSKLKVNAKVSKHNEPGE